MHCEEGIMHENSDYSYLYELFVLFAKYFPIKIFSIILIVILEIGNHKQDIILMCGCLGSQNLVHLPFGK